MKSQHFQQKLEKENILFPFSHVMSNGPISERGSSRPINNGAVSPTLLRSHSCAKFCYFIRKTKQNQASKSGEIWAKTILTTIPQFYEFAFFYRMTHAARVIQLSQNRRLASEITKIQFLLFNPAGNDFSFRFSFLPVSSVSRTYPLNLCPSLTALSIPTAWVVCLGLSVWSRCGLVRSMATTSRVSRARLKPTLARLFLVGVVGVIPWDGTVCSPGRTHQIGPSSDFSEHVIESSANLPQGSTWRNSGIVLVSCWVKSEKSAPVSSPFFPTSEISRIGPSRKMRDVGLNADFTRRR